MHPQIRLHLRLQRPQHAQYISQRRPDATIGQQVRSSYSLSLHISPLCTKRAAKLTGYPRLFFGNTKLIAVALPLTPESEAYPHTSLLTPHLHGSVGLLFSPRPPSAILSYFSTFVPLDFARAGSTASRTFALPPGVLYSRGGEISQDEDVPLAHSVEPNLRKLGLPTRLVKGKVELDGEFVVCKEGEVLGSGQTTLLKMFGIAMAEFRVGVEAYWERETGEVTVVGKGVKRKLDIEGTDVEEQENEVMDV